jgi:hypothetical protein
MTTTRDYVDSILTSVSDIATHLDRSYGPDWQEVKSGHVNKQLRALDSLMGDLRDYVENYL